MARTKIPIVVFRDNGTFAANASVVVNDRATGQQATVYASETGAVLPQPLTADARGRVPGWVDRGAYTAIVSGTLVTSYNHDFDSAPASAGAIDRAWLADAIINAAKMADFAVTPAKLQQDTLPVGTIALWWRPAATVPLPVNWQECRGQSLVVGQHDFPVAATITLPDLRNRFILGAASAIADGSAGSVGAYGTPASGNAPGIGGTGGSNVTRVPGHYHSRGTLAVVTDGDHTHSLHAQNLSSSAAVNNWPNRVISDTTGRQFDMNGAGIDNAGSHSHALSGSIGATGSGINGDTNIDVDGRPGYVGLLVMVKVKNT